MYSLTVTLNYSSFTKDTIHLANSQRELMEIARDYLNDPEMTSVIFTVVPTYRKEISNV